MTQERIEEARLAQFTRGYEATGFIRGAHPYEKDAEELLDALLAERAAFTTQEAELREVREARDAYRDGYEARGELLGYYRIGKRPSEKLLNRLSRIGASIAARSEHHDNEEGKA